ncbi:hypothetical protein D3C73_1522810 [compost metagenome]
MRGLGGDVDARDIAVLQIRLAERVLQPAAVGLRDGAALGRGDVGHLFAHHERIEDVSPFEDPVVEERVR